MLIKYILLTYTNLLAFHNYLLISVDKSYCPSSCWIVGTAQVTEHFQRFSSCGVDGVNSTDPNAALVDLIAVMRLDARRSRIDHQGEHQSY